MTQSLKVPGGRIRQPSPGGRPKTLVSEPALPAAPAHGLVVCRFAGRFEAVGRNDAFSGKSKNPCNLGDSRGNCSRQVIGNAPARRHRTVCPAAYRVSK